MRPPYCDYRLMDFGMREGHIFNTKNGQTLEELTEALAAKTLQEMRPRKRTKPVVDYEI